MELVIRSLREADLKEADTIFRLSFGTFLGLPDPMSFFGDTDYIGTRFRADPSLSLAVEVDGNFVGSNFIANWGSVGIFGPLTIHPDLWDKGIAKRLLDKTMAIFKELKTKHIGLFTFSHSPKHIHLYQKYDFWPRFLTAVMSKPVKSEYAEKESQEKISWGKYSDIQKEQTSQVLDNCSSLTDSIYDGLGFRTELQGVMMTKNNDPGYHIEHVYAIDDWR
jgi:N-acetylglutamate synthase-like GNAT family acetyltransferase